MDEVGEGGEGGREEEAAADGSRRDAQGEGPVPEPERSTSGLR